jgi:NAD(P)-dependent dehydrogenase (short-subunit alcohol dehydrogenase family)
MKTVLITGASGGIGRALCNYFSDRGMQVLAHARNEEKAKSVAGSSHMAIWGDVAKPEDVASIAEQVKAAGGLD